MDVCRIRRQSKITKPCANYVISSLVAIHEGHGVVTLRQVPVLVEQCNLFIDRELCIYWPLGFKTPDCF